MDTTRIYPSAVNTERSLLASFINHPSLINGKIKPADIYDSQYSMVLASLIEMKNSGKKIDAITLSDFLQKKTNEPELLVTEILQADFTKNIETHIETILEKAKRRRLIDYAERIKEQAYNSDSLNIDTDEISNILKTGIHSWTPDNTIPEWILSEPEPFRFIIPGLLASGVVGFIYGSGGTYKSLAALWLVLQRATMKIDASQKWFDKFELSFGKSVFFSAEDVQLDLHHRVFNIVSAMKDNRPDVPEQAFIDAIFENCRIIPREKWIEDGETLLIDSNGPTSKVNRIIDFINSFDAGLAILETCSRIAGIDENDNSAGARLVSVLETIRDKTGATILVIDHSSKINRGAKTDLQGQNSLRGAGSKLDNARFGLLIEAQKRSNGSDILQITNSKSFRCKRADSFKVKIQYPKFTLVEDEELEPDIFDRVINLIKDNEGITVSNIRKNITGSNAAINQALSDGKTEGLLQVMKKGGYKYVD